MSLIADKLRESGLAVDELSTRSGISVERLSLLLGGQEPTLAELRTVAGALHLTLGDFVAPSPAEMKTSLLFRRALSAGQKEKIALASNIEHVARSVGQASQLLAESGQTPEWLKAFGPVDSSYQAAESQARLFREVAYGGDQVSPLLRLPTIAVRDLGVLLFLIDSNQLEGASALMDGKAYVFLARRSFRPRMLFTLAHEIGHLVAHHNGKADTAFVDEPGDVFGYGKDKSLEWFADAFASILLLPSAGVGITLKKIKELTGTGGERIGDLEVLYLSHVFGVSFQVAARRCEDLHLIPRGGAQSLYEHLVKEHESPEKRAQSVGLPGRPEISFPLVPPQLLDAAISQIKSGRLSIGRAATVLNLTIGDLLAVNAGP